MKPSPRDSAATRKLLRLLKDNATGRLEVGAGGSTLSVYVLHGEVVAAVSADDDRQLLHLLRLRGDLPTDTLDALEAQAESGESIFGDLLTANPPSLEELLSQRFRQNLCDYVASLEKPTYAPQKGVFVDNIQMGHESRPLVEACCAFATKAQRIGPDQLLVRGPSTPRTDIGAKVAALLSNEPQSVYALTLRIPMEPTAARSLLVDLVTEGVAEVPGAVVPVDVDEEPEQPTESVRRPAAALLPDDDDDLSSEDALVHHLDAPIEPPPANEAVPSDLPPEGMTGDLPLPDVDAVAEGEADEPEPPAGTSKPLADRPEKRDVPQPDKAPQADEPEPDAEEPEADDFGPEDNEVDEFDAVVGDEGGQPSGGAPRSLAAWLADATHVDDDELDFFSDHDHDRGSGEDGAFSTESHNLDKVDVTNFDEDEVLEAEEAPSAPKFSAPVLGEEAAEAKIAVATDMLRKIVAAFDEAEGSGAGQAAMQLLVDGAPPKFVPLLTGLIVADDGSLNTGRVLANLYARPATEHRKLINDGLLNLMERALSKAADELPDELFDAVYEGVAGYKQRLGL